MPLPTRQRPSLPARSRTAPPVTPKDLLARATPVGDLPDEEIHLLLYGRNRVGKTTLACEFPKPLLLLSMEPTPTGGAKSVKKVPGVKILRYRTDFHHSDEVRELASAIPGSDYKTVVIDSGTSLDEIILAEVCGWDETANMLAVGKTRPGNKVTMDEYTERSERIRKVLRKYLDLNVHVVITANEKDHNPPESRKSAFAKGIQAESFFAAAMGGGSVRWLQDGCEVCQLYIDKETVKKSVTVGKTTTTYDEETGRLIRKLRTKYHPNYSAGLRSENRDSVPEYVDEPTFDKIRRIIQGAK